MKKEGVELNREGGARMIAFNCERQMGGDVVEARSVVDEVQFENMLVALRVEVAKDDVIDTL